MPMPYIKKELRAKLDPDIDKLVAQISDVNSWGVAADGEVNYIITRIIKSVFVNPSKSGETKESYFNYNRAIGVLECAKLELYRHQIGKYEDKKISENGDVE